MGSYTYLSFRNPLRTISTSYSHLRRLMQIRAKSDQHMATWLNQYETVETELGVDLAESLILEVGPGQSPFQLAYFTVKAREAWGLDIELAPTSAFDFKAYAMALRRNGFVRAAKSIGREVTGINSSLRAAFTRAMGGKKFPSLNIKVGDITQSAPFEEATFDVVYSTDVFEHLADPEQAMYEILRVLKPGGVLLVRTYHWANSNALHDMRVIAGKIKGRWAHLRPSLQHEVQQGAYVNQLRAPDYVELFRKHFDNVEPKFIPSAAKHLPEELDQARANGDLLDIPDEELLARHLQVRCTKPVS